MIQLRGRRRIPHRLFWLRLPRILLEAAVMVALFATTYWLAFLLRFEFRIPNEWFRVFLGTLPWFVGVKLLVFAWSKASDGWRYHVTFGDLIVLVRATAVAALLIVAIDHFLTPNQIPRSTIILDAMLTVLLYGGWQSLGRWYREQLQGAISKRDARRALLVVGDQGTGLLADQINSHTDLDYRICGVLTTHIRRGRKRHGRVMVVGHVRDVVAITAEKDIHDVLVVAGTVSGRRMRWLMTVCEAAGLDLKIIPPLQDLFSGNPKIPLRGIEIGDLLRRTPVQLDMESISELIEGRRVLVTGAGGSIGSEICRQILRFKPDELILLGRGENRIFQIEAELRAHAAGTRLIPTIACITDGQRMRQVFERWRPEVVFHAAAHKHVPLMEGNVGEAIKNNVGGTKTLVDLADEYEVKICVAISTDKAVNPTSVMGATKQLAERYIHSLARRSTAKLVSVRLGNVLGSAGSVVPVFQEQIRNGGPITVTHPEMTRYFMTIPEASQLVLQAGSMGRGGEVFVLDMGEPVRILDLARDLVRLSGLPAESIDIRFCGVRPGEKMHEELFGDGEQRSTTAHAKVFLAACDWPSDDELASDLERLLSLAYAGEDDQALQDRLAQTLPAYQPLSAVRPADHGGEPAVSASENPS